VAQVEQLAEERVVHRPGPILGFQQQRAPSVGVAREHPERHRVGIVGRDRDESVITGRMLVEIVGGQAVQRGRRDTDGSHVVADVPREVLVDDRHPFGDLPHPPARNLVEPDAAAAELEQHFAQKAASERVERSLVDRREHLVERLVETALGGGFHCGLYLLLGEFAHLRIRMHLRQQRQETGRVAQADLRLVPEVEHLLGGTGAAIDQRGNRHG